MATFRSHPISMLAGLAVFGLGCTANEPTIHDHDDHAEEDTSGGPGGLQQGTAPGGSEGGPAGSALDRTMAGIRESAALAPAPAPAVPAPGIPPLVIDVDPAQEAAELEQQNARIENPIDETVLYENFLSAALQNASVVLVIEQGPIEWTRVEDESGVWVRTIISANTSDVGGSGCALAQESDESDGDNLVLRIPFSFELPPLQPDEDAALLVIGSVSDGVLVADLVLPWSGTSVRFTSPDRAVAFSAAELDRICEEKLQ